jgi:hypothetical protein
MIGPFTILTMVGLKLKCVGLLLIAFFGGAATLQAQSAAALAKLQARYDASQLAEMQTETHYKYIGMLLYYSSSFLVVDGTQRPATETEIAAVNLDQYASLRSKRDAVIVHDATLGKDLVLLSRDEFEAVVLGHLSIDDIVAYNAYKTAALSIQGKSAE